MRRTVSLLALLASVLPHLVPSAARAAEPHAPFRVMTYNVRQVNDADTGLYAWTERSPNVIALIQENDPDVFGVQESSSAIIQDDLAAAFEAVYDRFQPENDSPKTIFFRRARFARLEAQPEDGEGIVSLENPYDEDDPCYPNASGRTAAWVKLRDLATDRGYLVVNAHTAHGGECFEARSAAADTLHELLAKRGEGLTRILFGDLNADAQSSGTDPGDERIIALLEEQQAGYRLARSARHTGTTDDGAFTFNSAWKAPSDSFTRLDYIFVDVADATTARQLVDRREIDGISPSDHFAVMATVREAIFAADGVLDAGGEAGAEGTRLALADMDGDKRADKIVWNPSVAGGKTRTLRSRGDGRFDPAIEDAKGPSSSADETLLFADVDGDGCADRFAWAAAIGAGAARVARGGCDGTFDGVEVSSDGSDGPSTRWSLARIDDDECVDLLAFDPTRDGGATRVALSRCDGSFEPLVLADDDGGSENADATIEIADVDGDGRGDKLVWDPEAHDGRTRVFLGDGDGTFTFLVEHAGGTSGVATSRFAYADVDGDGHADKLFWRATFRQGHPQLYLGTANGFEPDPIMINSGVSESGTNRQLYADIDGNGSADLVAWDADESGATRVFLARAAAELPGDGDGGEGPGGAAGIAGSGTAGSNASTGGSDAKGGSELGGGEPPIGDSCSCRTRRDDSSGGGLAALVILGFAIATGRGRCR